MESSEVKTRSRNLRPGQAGPLAPSQPRPPPREEEGAADGALSVLPPALASGPFLVLA